MAERILGGKNNMITHHQHQRLTTQGTRKVNIQDFSQVFQGSRIGKMEGNLRVLTRNLM